MNESHLDALRDLFSNATCITNKCRCIISCMCWMDVLCLVSSHSTSLALYFLLFVYLMKNLWCKIFPEQLSFPYWFLKSEKSTLTNVRVVSHECALTIDYWCHEPLFSKCPWVFVKRCSITQYGCVYILVSNTPLAKDKWVK